MSAKKVTISKSDKAGKKLMAKFTADNGRVDSSFWFCGDGRLYEDKR